MSLTSTCALISAALFTGAAAYISLVEHPARLTLADGPLLAEWKPSYAKALPPQSALAIIGGACGIASFFAAGGWLWLAGSLALLANWPFTLLAIMPTNRALKAIPIGEAGPRSRSLLVSWGKLHAVRSGLGLLSTLLFALATEAAA